LRERLRPLHTRRLLRGASRLGGTATPAPAAERARRAGGHRTLNGGAFSGRIAGFAVTQQRTDMSSEKILQTIATELNVRPQQVAAAIALLDEGATVPFIARYRKEATGGLDDTQLRALEERLAYLRELEERREAILKLIAEQGKLTPELE